MPLAAEVLSVFDLAARTAEFPTLGHPYVFPVDGRITCWTDTVRWAVAFDLAGYTLRSANLDDVVTTFGNCLTGRSGPTFEAAYHARIDNAVEVVDDEFNWIGMPLRIRGRSLSPGGVAGRPIVDVCRALIPEHRDLILADPQETTRLLPADLSGTGSVLRLEEWFEPEEPIGLIASSQVETWQLIAPSQVETWQLIARFLQTGDRAVYRPTEPANSHWSFWTEVEHL